MDVAPPPHLPGSAADRRIRVAVVDDTEDFASGLAHHLGRETDLEWCGRFRDAAEARAAITAARPRVILVELRLPGESGLALLPHLPILAPGAEAVVLTSLEDPGTISAAVEQGANGYLLKREGMPAILAAIRRVAAGGVALGDAPGRALLHLFRQRRRVETLLPQLSPQENRLLMMLSEGQSLKQAAAAAGITYETSRRYMVSVYRKLRVESMTQAVCHYLRQRRN